MKRKRESKETAMEAGSTAKKTQAASTKAPVVLKSALKKSGAIAASTASERRTKAAVQLSKDKTKAKDKTKERGKAVLAATVPATVSAPSASGLVAAAAPTVIQIVTGSYDRTLHGVTATVINGGGGSGKATVQFADSFLFNAHTSAIRCLALSPPSVPVPGQAQKVMLATGSTDERINIYNLSAHPPVTATVAATVSAAEAAEESALVAELTRRPAVVLAQDSKNRELGTLLHHTSTVTRLAFPTRSKLLSASEDSTVAVTRTRDWSLLSSIRAPVPKPEGTGVYRPSGDTSAPGAAPSGINDFAVHPSMKVMLSVSRGERCMRLWNLVTGKKAGVLNFGRELLRDLGEKIRIGTGEGQQVEWGRCFSTSSKDRKEEEEEEVTDEFAIGFDRNVVVFGMDSRPRCKVLTDARTKVHDFHYLEVGNSSGASVDAGQRFSVLAFATEDGRILLSSTRPGDLDLNQDHAEAENSVADNLGEEKKKKYKTAPELRLPVALRIGQIGGKAAGVTGRVKAFKVLPVDNVGDDRHSKGWLIVAVSSSGALRVFCLAEAELRQAWQQAIVAKASKDVTEEEKQLGQLLGLYETQDRITCVEAFVMIPRPEGLEDSEDEAEDTDGIDEDEESE